MRRSSLMADSTLRTASKNSKLTSRAVAPTPSARVSTPGSDQKGGWGPDHDNLVYDLAGGMLVLDVVDGVIRFVEVLDRPDLGWAKSKGASSRR